MVVNVICKASFIFLNHLKEILTFNMYMYGKYISFGNKETNLVYYSEKIEKKNDFSKKEKDMADFFS